MKTHLILLSWYTSSCLWTVYLPYSLQSTAMVAVGVGLCYAARRWPDVARWCIFGLLAVNLWAGLAQAWWGVTLIPQAVPPAGFNGNKNLLASLIVGAGPVAATVTPWIWLPCAVMLWEVSSKASFVAMAAMGLYWCWWRLRTVKGRIIAGAGIVALGAVVLVAGMAGMVGSQTSYSARLAFNVNSLFISQVRPIHGFGPGTGGAVYYLYHEPVMQSYSAVVYNRWPRRLHNDWMQAQVELGIVGLTLYMAILVNALKAGRNTYAGVALFGLSLNALMDFPLQLPSGCWVWWALAGLCYASGRDRDISKQQKGTL